MNKTSPAMQGMLFYRDASSTRVTYNGACVVFLPFLEANCISTMVPGQPGAVRFAVGTQ